MSKKDSVLLRNPDMVFRKIGGECMLVPIQQKDSKNQIIFVLNEVAGRVWELIDGKKSVEEIVEILRKEFKTDKTRTERDVLRLLKNLKQIGGISHGMS